MCKEVVIVAIKNGLDFEDSEKYEKHLTESAVVFVALKLCVAEVGHENW